MLEVLLLATAIAWGAPLPWVAVLGLAVAQPVICLVAIAAHSIFHSGRAPAIPAAAVFCSAVADELRAGSPVRTALAAAIQSAQVSGVDEADLNGPIDVVANAIAAALPEVGPEISVCIARSARTGAPAADLFDELAAVAMVEAEVRREVRTAMAPARVTSVILVAVPVIAVSAAVSSGDVSAYLATSPQRMAVLFGGVLVLGSFVVGASMIRRSL
jgi:hypothetical protein